MRSRHVGELAVTLVALALISFLGLYLVMRGSHANHAGQAVQSAPAEGAGHHRCGEVSSSLMPGVAVNTPLSRNVSAVAKATGTTFRLTEVYDAFGSHPFQRGEAEQAAALNAVPVIQLNPRTVSLAQIAAGKYDSYLRKYSDAVRQFGCRVILSFGHEMNGYWYPWGCRHTDASVFIAAWRHIFTVMHPAKNITWMWTVNVEANRDCPLTSRWPGSRYVDWIGVDGYLRRPGSTFQRIFVPTLTRLRQLGKPVLISEAGALAGPGQAQRIFDIYHGAVRSHVLGVIYFDSVTSKFGDYRPQDNPAALSAFRKALNYFQNAHTTTATKRVRH